ncbi:MAG: dicarboxylate/amino acid:cation symporter [Nitrosomonadales bacterium]|jgi:Na+/H+-dicarboxylate symporter|nr:dicarboxylate/amino acid:cation symporter [Nitrosomonadales bacterium]MBT5573585.1 dicarboxylate/amino acid:cation symporter [Nitrosomonadales bacterium]MBT7689428.1 dicarboxylate/amino acid:cation symporter [Nitrosomonadales bacterium]
MKNANKYILLAALAGIIMGLVIKNFPDSLMLQYISDISILVGKIFITALKMILVPLVFFSIVNGISNLASSNKAGTIWRSTLLYFAGTMFFAVFIAMLAMNYFKPGVGISIDAWQLNEVATADVLSLKDFIYQFILGLFENPFASLSDGKILPLIVFSILIGVTLNEKNKALNSARDFFRSFYEIIFKIVNWIMFIAPFGIFGLLVNMVISQNLTIFSQLGIFMMIVIGIILFHGIIFLPTLLFLFNRINIYSLWKGGRISFISAFATSSSSATLPITLKASQDNFGVSKDVSNFVLPIGATMNMDGTAMYEAAAALFIANLVGLDLSLSQQFILFFIAMIASIGAPGIPSAGMVTMAMVLQVLGLPLEALGILIPMDRLLDTFRTTVNVEGDLVGSLIIDKFIKT